MTDLAPRILVVDDDAIVADSIAASLRDAGHRAESCHVAEFALETLASAERLTETSPPDPFAVMIVDMSMPGLSGMDLIRAAREAHPDVVPIAITGYGTIEAAVRAVRLGAVDYLTKPLVDEELRIAVEKAVRQHTLVATNGHLRRQLDHRYGMDNIVGADARMRRIFDVIEAVAPARTTVLMCGESGTGKSMIARAIHRRSPRADAPFVELACGSIPETLLESELFGHVKGAFTGAHVDKPGRFLAADRGTLFLDEINSASPGMQLKLLRVLQERVFEPVGSNRTVEVDVRVILATNQPLEDLVARGEFRPDLYYRINVVNIELPPLRDRVMDVPLLAEHTLARCTKELGRVVTGFTPEAMRALQAYSFPGNVRELENIIERAIVLTRATVIDVADLPPHVVTNRPPGRAPTGAGAWPLVDGEYHPMPLRQALEEPEKRIILAALEANDWNRQKTAEALQVNRTTLYKKIKHFGLEEYGRVG